MSDDLQESIQQNSRGLYDLYLDDYFILSYETLEEAKAAVTTARVAFRHGRINQMMQRIQELCE